MSESERELLRRALPELYYAYSYGNPIRAGLLIKEIRECLQIDEQEVTGHPV